MSYHNRRRGEFHGIVQDNFRTGWIDTVVLLAVSISVVMAMQFWK